MKILGRKLLFIILPLAIAVTHLHAQTDGGNPPAGNSPESSTAVTNATAASNGVAEAVGNPTGQGHRPPRAVTINQGPHEGGPTFPELVILTITTFMLPVCIVGMVFYSRHRRAAMLHDTLRLMIEKGVAIPPELLQPAAKPNTMPMRKANDFRNGMILVGVGVALTLINLFDDHSRMGAVGLIPLCIGVAFLISWKTGQKSDQPGN